MLYNVYSFIMLLIFGKIAITEKLQAQFGSNESAFTEHYTKFNLPNVKEFEARRLKALGTLRTRCLLFPITFITIIVIGILIDIFAQKTNLTKLKEYIPYFIVLLLIINLLWIYLPIMLYKSSVKAQIFPEIFKFFGNFQYSEFSTFPVYSLINFDILPNFTQSQMKDSVKGVYKDCALRLTQAELLVSNNRSKFKNLRTVFQGILILLNMNKRFSGKTIVKTNTRIYTFLDNFYTDLQKVELEDSEFESKFDVYSTDQIEARYLLSTSFMDRLLKLKKVFHDTNIQCSFFENKLLMMIPSKKNYFALSSIFKPATFEDDISTILEEMNFILQIIDILKLDQQNRL